MSVNFVKKVAVVFAVMMFAGQTSTTMTAMAESNDVSVKQFSALPGIKAEAMTSGELSKIEAKGNFTAGYCTWYVDQLVRSNWKLKNGTPWKGNAKDWYSNAKAAGYKTGSSPKAGSIVVYNKNVGGGNGHVAYVTKVNKKDFVVTEMNWTNGLFNTDTRTIKNNAMSNIAGFIYNQKK